MSNPEVYVNKQVSDNIYRLTKKREILLSKKEKITESINSIDKQIYNWKAVDKGQGVLF